jgi:hypothetical protein
MRHAIRPALRALFLLLVLIGVTAGRARAFSMPALDLSMGQSFGVDGSPNDGGLSVEFAPLWRAGERAHFGIAAFADDIGNDRQSLSNKGVDLGTVVSLHRMTWGYAWRADYDFARGRKWAAAVTGVAGWWRIQDDVRGINAQAASAVGAGLGLSARRTLTGRHEVGLSVRWRALTNDKSAEFQRVDHYATAALQWRWGIDVPAKVKE